MKNNFKHVLLLGILILISQTKVFATHYRAGEIWIEQIGPLTIRATVFTYTKSSSSAADKSEVDVFWGDGSTEKVKRTNGAGIGVFLPNDLRYNEFTTTHTYSGRGSYQIGMVDPNRTGGILNINFPNSDLVPFYVQTIYTFLNSSSQGPNTTPRLLQPPIDRGCVGKTFVHSLNAFDPDGDSIAYRIGTPFSGKNNFVPRYDFPDAVTPGANNKISFDEKTGRFVWNAPQMQGEYNIAFLIISYRGGVPIDTTVRDMQVTIENCKNDPPKVETIEQICVIAGQIVRFQVRATDPNIGQKVSLTASGGPFAVKNPAVFRGTGGTNIFRDPPVEDTFSWQTTCDHIQAYPYTVVFKAIDNFFDTTGLVDLKTVQIKVVAPPPVIEDVVPSTNQMTVLWTKPYACEAASDNYFYAFSVWRREGSNPFLIDKCVTGLEGKGYNRIAFQTNYDVINGRYVFVDKNVESGKTYCYRILAHFAKRTTSGNNPYNFVESLPSLEICGQLKRDIPLIINASVQATNATTGRIFVRWTKPLGTALDTVLFPPPYKYVVFRADGITKTVTQPIVGASFTSPTFFGANDTVWTDNNLNTVQNPYTYKIGFYYKTDSLIGFSTVASSHFLTVGASDRVTNLSWQKDVPWTNSQYDIFRRNALGVFDSIGTTTATTYSDSGLVNKKEYCYYVRAVGSYSITGIPSPLFNLSQQACATPLDTVPPCPPVLTVKNACDTTGVIAENDIKNLLSWTSPVKTCRGSEDAVKYKVYYSNTEGGVFRVIETIEDINKTNTEHREGNSIAGCYYVTALDTTKNESKPSNIVCVDNCPFYELPNAFTPNGDGQNDKFTPRKMKIRFINKVEFKVYNRWGNLVFETDKPSLDWNGQNLTGADVAEGTYFYTCSVFEQRLDGAVLSPKILRGYIEVAR